MLHPAKNAFFPSSFFLMCLSKHITTLSTATNDKGNKANFTLSVLIMAFSSSSGLFNFYKFSQKINLFNTFYKLINKGSKFRDVLAIYPHMNELKLPLKIDSIHPC